MNQSVKGYRNLKVWQEAHQFVLMIYRVTEKYPKSEMFGLVSQMRRAAVSVAANIVEGHVKKSKVEFARFLEIAIGSLIEVEYYLELSLDLKYIAISDYQSLDQQRLKVGNMLFKFRQSLKH